MQKVDMSRIGVITDEIDPGDTLSAIACARELRLGFVDLRTVFGHSIKSITDQERDKIRQACTENDLAVGTICSGYGKCLVSEMTDAEQLDRLKKDINTAKNLETRIVRIFAGFYKGQPGEEDQAAEKMRTALKIAQDAGILLVLEHEPVTLTRSASFTKRLVEEANSDNLKILFEPTNLYLSAEDPLAAWHMLGDVSVGMHIKDATVADKKKWSNGGLVNGGWEWQTLGDGNVPWEKLTAKVLAAGYKGTFSIELHCGPSAALAGVSVGRLKAMLGIKSPR